MNNGAFIFEENFFSSQELQDIADMARTLERSKAGVHDTGKYSHLKWFKVDLSPELQFCKKILDYLKVSRTELLVFYYLDPGAKIHPHRDLTGAGLNNRIRFHVPIITNSRVKFTVAGDAINMRPGDLWCLDTSYVHAVENDGDEARVHIVIECEINNNIKIRLPRGFSACLHNFKYIVILMMSFMRALLINSLRDPKYFIAQMKMIFRFVGWRFIKKIKPK